MVKYHMAKVVVGMSGGVDSSVTAHLLKQQGYEVEGVSFLLWEARNRTDFTACCALEARDSAAKTCSALGLEHRSVDVRNAFLEKVIGPFVEAYKNGLTPNPCILCNKYIKFPYLLKAADEIGAEYIATGHYARVENCGEAAPGTQEGTDKCLKKGADRKKDQSYVLHVLQKAWLQRLLLPLGNLSKNEVRETARALELPAADRPESQEICFIEKNYSSFMEKIAPEAAVPGPILGRDGKSLGIHKGIYSYTVGQRKGLGIPSLMPHFVTGIDPVRNIIYAGLREDAMSAQIFVRGINWLLRPGSDSFRAQVKVRSMMDARPANIEANGDRAVIIFDSPQWAPAPGQSAVFYDGDIVLGGGVIYGG